MSLSPKLLQREIEKCSIMGPLELQLHIDNCFKRVGAFSHGGTHVGRALWQDKAKVALIEKDIRLSRVTVGGRLITS